MPRMWIPFEKSDMICSIRAQELDLSRFELFLSGYIVRVFIVSLGSVLFEANSDVR